MVLRTTDPRAERRGRPLLPLLLLLLPALALDVVAQEGAARGEAPSEESLRQAKLVRLNRALVTLEEQLRESPGLGDVAAIANDCDGDPRELTRFIREDVAWEPYAGLLRGARGALIARSANALDRALLLAALLEASGFAPEEVQIAHAVLDPDAAATLLDERWLPRRDREPDRRPPALTEDAFAALDGLATRDTAQRLLTESWRRGVDELATLRDRGEAQAELLAGLVDFEGDADADAARAAALQRAAQYYWVRLRVDDQWTDLDTIEPAETRRGPPTLTFAASDVPEELRHRLEIRIVTERRLPGGAPPETSVPLRHGFDAHGPAADGSGLWIGFYPLGVSRDDEAELEVQAAAVADGCDEWLPILRVGDDPVWQQSVRVDGTLNENPSLMLGGKVLSDATRAIGGLGAAPRESAWTGAWVEFERIEPIDGAPGSNVATRTVRRELFDLARWDGRGEPPGEEARAALARDDDERRRRRGLALQQSVRVLPVTADVSAEALQRRTGVDLANSRRAVLAEAIPGAKGGFEDFAWSPLEVWHWSVLRRRASPVAHATHIASVQLACVRTGWRDASADLAFHASVAAALADPGGEANEGGEEGEDTEPTDGPPLVLTTAFDVVFNDVGVRLDADLDPRVVRLTQGVVDTVAETGALPGTLEQLPLLRNAAEYLETATGFGIDPLVISPGEDAAAAMEPSLHTLPFRQRLLADLDDGKVVVTGREALVVGPELTSAYYRIDSETGETLGITCDGLGGHQTERALVETVKGPAATSGGKAIGKTVVCHVISAVVGTIVGLLAAAGPVLSAVIAVIVGLLVDIACAGGPRKWLRNLTGNGQRALPPGTSRGPGGGTTHFDQRQVAATMSRIIQDYPSLF